MKKIIEFLLKAKKAAYAGKGPEVKPCRPNSHDLEYIEGDLKYIDTYLGSSSFIGEEAVWEDNNPIWSMNYCGRVLNDGFEGDFLKEALREVPFDKPFRGPKEFRRGNFLYLCDVKGEFEWFSGQEEILLDDAKVYECMFHGGKVK